MSTPDDPTPPPPELGGLDPQQLFEAALRSAPLQPLPPDPGVTLPVAGPRPSQPSAPQVELPLPEELTALLPAAAYKVESFLGQGGMGAVYKGTQVRLKRPVAIKIMRRDMGKDYDFEQRFEREAQAMAKLNHPNIVSVIDFGEAGPDYLYIVMELIDGADLMDVIRGGQMTQEMALTLLPQICDALQFAHDHGIVHRDIKPSNIMLTRDGRIKMADFGLAKRYDAESSFRTQTGTGMGTPDYAAPEQFDSHAQIDHRADIYALGVMIYQMITGQLPRGVWKPPSQRAQISPQWDDIVSHAMQSDPKDRYQQASEVKTAVGSITSTTGREGSAGIPSATTQPVRPAASGGKAARKQEADKAAAPSSESKPRRAPLLVIAVVIVLGSIGMGLWLKKSPSLPTGSDARNEVETLKAAGSAGVDKGVTWQNLIPLIQPARHTVNGNWEVKDGELICKASPWALCEIPVDYHGGSYDLRVAVTRGEGDRLALFFPFRKGDTAGDVVFDYFDHFSDGLKRAGLENLGGLKQSDPGSVFRMKSEWIPKGQKSTVLLQVRDEGIAVSLNGAEVYRWKADWSKLRQAGGFENEVFAGLKGRHVFGVGLFNCDAIYHRIEMREVAGEEARLLPSLAVEAVSQTAASTVVPSPNPPVSKSSDPKFPPGQWVKLFTKPEELPGNLRQAQLKIEDGWIRCSLSETGKGLLLPAFTNGGVRARFRVGSAADPTQTKSCIYLREAVPGQSYSQGVIPGKLMCQRREGDRFPKVFETPLPQPVSDEYKMEFGVVGSRLVGSANNQVFSTALDTTFQGRKNVIQAYEDVRDIEVINLDGLPEAEALRLLGVDEQGNDLRGKTGAASAVEPWDPKVSRAAAEMAVTKARMIKIEQDGKRTMIRFGQPLPPGDFRLVHLEIGSDTTDETFNKRAAQITVEELRIMIAPPELFHINVKSVQVLDDESCRTIATKPGLKIAGFQNANLSNGLLRHFSQAALLENLHLGLCPITDAGLAHLSKLQYLRNLELSNCKITGKAVAALVSAGRLEILVMGNGSGTTAVDVAAICEGCPRLQTLRVAGPTTVESLSGIKQLRELTSLRFIMAALSRAHLGALAEAPVLSELSLEKCTVAEDAWAALLGLKLLTKLTLVGIPRSAAIDAAAKQMPKLKTITIDGVARSPSGPVSPSGAAASSPSSATKATPFINTLGMKFVPVPITGGPTSGKRVLFSVWETRVQDFEVFVKEAHLEWPEAKVRQKPTDPVAEVNWEDAQAFCQWLTERERKTGKLGANERYRLPSDHEWSCAVGIGDREDASELPISKSGKLPGVFPWGSVWPPPAGAGNYGGEEIMANRNDKSDPKCVTGYRDLFAGEAPVGSFAPDRFGLFDLSGNVWEWCEDWFDATHKTRALRGAAAGTFDRKNLGSASRVYLTATARMNRPGFRCVLDASALSADR